MKTTLLIMAAGIGSRFGGGVKQLEPVGLNDEIIMDYSVHDAIAAGFNKLIFVIRKDIEKDFGSASVIGSKRSATGWAWRCTMHSRAWMRSRRVFRAGGAYKALGNRPGGAGGQGADP